MVVKIAANSFATSLIGSQVKPLASRCSSGVSHSESNAISSRAASRIRFCSSSLVPRMSTAMPGRQFADSRMAAMMAAISGTLTRPRTLIGLRGSTSTGNGFSAVTPDIERAEHREQQACHESGLRQEMSRGPEEVDAIEEADEQWRVAQRTQCAADIGHQNDEKNKHMGVVLPREVGADQRPDQDHRRARGADDAGHHGTECEDGCVIPGRASDIAADQNPARNRVEREQQHDEAEVLCQHGVNESRYHRPDPAKPAERG